MVSELDYELKLIASVFEFKETFLKVAAATFRFEVTSLLRKHKLLDTRQRSGARRKLRRKKKTTNRSTEK